MAAYAAYAAWASLALTAYTTVKAGEETKANTSRQARSEEANAKTREIERKRELVRALAAGNVKAGASGTSGGIGSSQEALMKRDISNENLDMVADMGATSQRITQLKANGESAQNFAMLSAAGSVAGGVARYYKRGDVDDTSKTTTPKAGE